MKLYVLSWSMSKLIKWIRGKAYLDSYSIRTLQSKQWIIYKNTKVSPRKMDELPESQIKKVKIINDIKELIGVYKKIFNY